jgi:outer membrane lipoprotein SlyB
MFLNGSKIVLSSLLVSTLMFSGCATNDGPEVSSDSVEQMKVTEIGTITSVRGVVLKDNGTGLVVGAIAGAALGSLFGGGDGKIFTALAGGVVGGYAGHEIGKSNGQELKVKLDNGRLVTIVVKHNNYLVGDKIEVTIAGNKVTNTRRI